MITLIELRWLNASSVTGKATMMVRVDRFPGLDFGLRRKRRLRAILQRGKRLKISVEIDGGDGFGSRVSAGCFDRLCRLRT